MFDMDTVLDDDDVFANRRSSADSALNNTEPRKDILVIAENTLHGISRLDDDKNFQMFETRFLLEGSATGRRRRRRWNRIASRVGRVAGELIAGMGRMMVGQYRRSELADLVTSPTLTKSVIMVGFEDDPRRRVGKFSACLQVCVYNTVRYAHKNDRSES
jgi:hypothetical protein